MMEDPGRGEVSGCGWMWGMRGGLSILTEVKQKGTVHRSVPQVLYMVYTRIAHLIRLD